MYLCAVISPQTQALNLLQGHVTHVVLLNAYTLNTMLRARYMLVVSVRRVAKPTTAHVIVNSSGLSGKKG